MGLFNNLMSKIFGHASPTASTTTTAPGTQASSGSASSAAPVATAEPVDVAANLDGMAAKNSEKLDWKHSIVDLMKLVGMDSSLSARKQLATELHYSGDQNDSASMNIWLHKEVLKIFPRTAAKSQPTCFRKLEPSPREMARTTCCLPVIGDRVLPFRS